MLLHGFQKKTNQLPESEIQKALNIKKSVLEDLKD
ncbi:MAG: type II toxin-antitoxin system RelE/ParE family toxin [Halanaerobium sp.]